MVFSRIVLDIPFPLHILYNSEGNFDGTLIEVGIHLEFYNFTGDADSRTCSFKYMFLVGFRTNVIKIFKIVV